MLKQALSLEALEVLDAIDRRGSFAAAASILHKVPSAITYTVHKLEQDLGVPLFVKQGRNSVLTDAGRLLLEQGREILEAAERLTESTRLKATGWESSLNIAIDNVIGSEHVFELIQAFFEIKPDIEINLFQEVLGGGWEALTEQRADIAIGMPRKADNKSLFRCEEYCTSQWVFAVHPANALASLNRPLTTEDIECQRAIVVRDSSRNQAKLTHRLFSKRPVLSVHSIEDKIIAQKKGLGVGYLPKAKIESELTSGELTELAVQGINVNETHYLGWRRGEKGKAIRWFIDRLRLHRS